MIINNVQCPKNFDENVVVLEMKGFEHADKIINTVGDCPSNCGCNCNCGRPLHYNDLDIDDLLKEIYSSYSD
mgnify:CR=1 FL=1